MPIWVIVWLIIALIAVVGEVATTGLFLATVAAAAVLAAGTALFLPVIVQAVVFAVAGLAGIAFLRPILAGALGFPSSDLLFGPFAQSHIVGRRGVVTQTIEPGGGQIRIGQGEFWTARPFNDTDVISPGMPVEILLVEGLTALVAPIPGQEIPESLTDQLSEETPHEEPDSQTEGATGAKGTSA